MPSREEREEVIKATAPDLMQYLEDVWRANTRALLAVHKEAGNIVDFKETKDGFDIEPVQPLKKIGVRLRVGECE